MPRTPRDGLFFLLGVWLIFILLSPLMSPWAWAADPALARSEGLLHRSVNEFRRQQHLIPLARDPRLDAVAAAHSEDMARRGFFSHESPEGLNWVDRLRAAGVAGFALAGENVGQTNRPDPNGEILNGWKASPAHRENLTARPYNATGIGIARAPDGRLFYTQLYVTFTEEEDDEP